VKTDLSPNSVAFGMKLVENEEEDIEGYVGVQLGDSSTRSLKIMAFDSTFETPVELYHYKAKHGESEYRELGLNDDGFTDYDDSTP
jgi:hypothetical protein